ncbi:DUF4191 domain-containing protein [Aeromicrobium duanguangcaii]|uniref:DUF4191 domain-containing protein n=1 Tax=Aeromicrobium duanguangcaii TaxID=2968086 RepID=A0ABY5KGI0_9ACTN|nr:DUF4191 domain-containing protein [Aeromicrobium duanguangcaii]MCD9153316.1 DUF4191 domain-containing protein [Aeromicrobium duanguangcaii]UUI69589.1 DUF4191 domain-containing protein [Aeromicrobium duanguangcaii]
MSSPAPAVPTGRLAQLRNAYQMTKKTQPRIGLLLLGVFVLSAAAVAALGVLLLGTAWFSIIITAVLALTTSLLVTMIVFGKRAEKSMYQQAEGQLGAGAGALQMLRRGWDVKPAVGFTKQQDVVHRLVGRPGVVLVGEGQHARVKNLLASEAKKHQRIVGDGVPVTTLIVGRGEGEVPLPNLVKRVKKLPKAIKPAQQTDVLYKLKALDAMRPAAPMPRGPMPTSMKGARKAMRG